MQFSVAGLMHKLDNVVDVVLEHWKVVAAVVAAGVIAIAGWVAYDWHHYHQQVKAHNDFVQASKILRARVSASRPANDNDTAPIFNTEEEKWAKVSEVFAKAYQENKSSGLAGMFLSVQADAAAKRGLYDDAVKLIDQAIPLIAHKTVRDFFVVKSALYKLDNANADVNASGVAQLNQVIQTPNHHGHELALYYLGQYHWAHNNFAQAKEAWQQMVVRYGSDKSKVSSGLVEQAKSKLKLISADF